MNNEELQIEKINQYITNLNTETGYYSSCKISNSDIGYFLKNGPAYLYKKLMIELSILYLLSIYQKEQ